MAASLDLCTWCGRPFAEHAPDPAPPPGAVGWVCCPGSGRKVAPDEFDAAPALDRGEGLGLGRDAPVIENDKGGRQSHTPYRCDLFPPFAFLAVAEVLAHGAAKYGPNNWHAITVPEHLNHAIGHLFAFLAGDGSDDHLGHAACRVVMALDQKRSGRDEPAA